MDTSRVAPRNPFLIVGAVLFFIWGFLHIYVGVLGAATYLGGDLRALWGLLIGGVNAPAASFQYPTDVVTAHAQSQLILNFVLDVGASGVLGWFVAWLLATRASWSAYFIGVVVIGIIDNAFLFSMVTSGIIASSWETWGGPLVWLLACLLTPFGLPRREKKD